MTPGGVMTHFDRFFLGEGVSQTHSVIDQNGKTPLSGSHTRRAWRGDKFLVFRGFSGFIMIKKWIC